MIKKRKQINKPLHLLTNYYASRSPSFLREKIEWKMPFTDTGVRPQRINLL